MCDVSSWPQLSVRIRITRNLRVCMYVPEMPEAKHRPVMFSSCSCSRGSNNVFLCSLNKQWKPADHNIIEKMLREEKNALFA